MNANSTITKVFVTTYLCGLALFLILRALTGDRFWGIALLSDFAPLLFIPLLIVLPIILWIRQKFLILLALIHGLVAIFWFGARFMPTSQQPVASQSVHIITFNVWGHNEKLYEFEQWVRDTNPDFVLLQEIPEQYANKQIPELDDLYPYQIGQSTDVRWWGNLFLSKHPIMTEETLLGEGVPAQQRFTVDFNGQIIAIYNVHFAMPIGEPRLPLHNLFVLETAVSYNNHSRNIEINRLLSRLESEPYPFIVAGDFNMSEYAVIYKQINQHMTDAYLASNHDWGGTWPMPIVDELPSFVPPLLRVDYIWHSAHLHTAQAYRGPALGSDHLPLYAELEIAKLIPLK